MRSQLGNVIPLWSSVILLLNVVHFLHHAADWQIFEHLSYKHISGVQDYKVILSDLLMVTTIMWLLRGNFQTTNQINKLDKPIRSSKVKRSGRRKKMKRDRFQLSSLPCKTPTGKNEAKPFFEKRILGKSFVFPNGDLGWWRLPHTGFYESTCAWSSAWWNPARR